MKLIEVFRAAEVIRPYIYQMPMRYCHLLSERSGASVWLKLENWQPTGSFKIRGALNRLNRLTEEEKAQGVAAADRPRFY
jgi:threonine dehydratase